MALYDDKSLYDYIVELSIIDQNKLDELYEITEKQGVSFEKLLIETDLISDKELGKIVSDLISIPYVRLTEYAIPNEILSIIPEIVAKKQQIIAFEKDKQGLHLAMADPSNIQIIDFVQKKAGFPVIVHYATKRDISDASILYSKNIIKAFAEIIEENVNEVKNVKNNNIELPIIKIVDTILSYAYRNKSSDVHIEPERTYSLVRFRIDGVLHDIVKLPPEIHTQVITRIKVMSRLRTDEHQASQDGKLQFEMEEERLDVRVSIVPIVNGEKAVLRLLSERSRQFTLSNLGITDNNLEKMEEAYHKPYGMILVTGPTGCGKTTTLYAVLKKLNKRDVNIMTIEDPVEYEMENVNQIQVNPKTNLTFAAGLRSIVRQDPNIILVGEIRDSETADIAINSAMTGHLVLSTLHTNDAATAIPRLFDMGVEPFLVSSSINIIVAQRLVRSICGKCRTSLEVKIKDITKNVTQEIVKKHFGSGETIRVYQGKGCAICHNTGYEGRVGIFEVLSIDEEIRTAIVNRQDAAEIAKIAIKNGMTTMIENGLEKIKEGITTLDEVLRVTKE